jgi:hypothetical protein
VYFRFL